MYSRRLSAACAPPLPLSLYPVSNPGSESSRGGPTVRARHGGQGHWNTGRCSNILCNGGRAGTQCDGRVARARKHAREPGRVAAG
eukprot:356109-Rhodomonas_salina.2